jgi:predicted nuclease of predicted toxin-antitoxin system
MPGLILDQGLPRSAARIFREMGWDAVHTGEIGMAIASDHAILEYARTNSCIIITLDADFHTILALSGARNPSVVRLRLQGLKGQEIVDILLQNWPFMSVHLDMGAMVSITGTHLRIKKLPIFESPVG